MQSLKSSNAVVISCLTSLAAITIPIGTMRSILRQAKLTTEEFEALYRQ